MAIKTDKTLADWQAIYNYWLANQGAQQDLPINPTAGTNPPPVVTTALPPMKPLPPNTGLPNPYDPRFPPPSGKDDHYAPMPPGLGPNGYIEEDLSAPPDKMPRSTSAPPPNTGLPSGSPSPLSTGAGMVGLGGELSVMGGYGSGYNINSPEYKAWMEAQAKAGAKPAELDPSKMTAEEFAAARPPWNVTTSGPHPSSNDPRDMNGDGTPDAPPPGLTGLPPSTTTPPTASGPADTLPGNPGIDTTDANKNGTPDIYEQGPGAPGYTSTKPAAPKIDRDGNGIDDREQTTVGGTGPFGPNYADMWAQTLAANPQMGYGGNGQMGWGGAMNTGTGPVIGGGGDSGLGGYGTTGGGSGGNFSLPGGATGTGTGGFQMPDFNPPAFTDVSGIGTTTSGTGSPSTGGTGGTGFQFPDFQSPSTTTGTTGTTTGTTSPLAGYGSAPSTGTPNTGLVQNLAGSYQQQIDAANASNESRYGTGLEMLLKRYEQAGNAMLGLTNEGVADIGRQFDRARASMDQGLIDRGLSNTTVRSAIDRGYTTDQAQAVNRYWDDQARKNLDEQFRQTGAITDWIGGRNDVAPSTGDLANLASGVGSAGPGATTTTGTPSTTTSTATPAPVNLPPQVTTALQNGTLGSLAATQPGVNPAGTTPSSGFLNQGAGITTPAQLSAAVNGGGTTRAQTAAPPPPSSPLAGYGSTTTPAPQTDAQKLDAATAAFKQQVAERYNPAALAGQLSRAANPGGSTPQFDTGVMFNTGPKAGAGVSDVDPMKNFDPNVRVGGGTGPGTGGGMVTTGGWIPNSPPGSTDYKLPSGYSGETAQNPNGVGTITAPPPVSGGAVWGGPKNPTTPDYVSMPGGSSPMPPPPPPGWAVARSSPSVMGFPDPQGTGMAPGNPNDVREAMRAQNPNNSQLQGLMAGADSWMKGYGQTDPGYRFDTTNQSQSIATATPQPMNPTQASAPPPSLGKVPQRPEPVSFNTAATPPASPLSGYGTTPPGMPSFMAPPGPTPAPTFQQMGVPGTQYKPPSLVGGVTMPQPPARRWGV